MGILARHLQPAMSGRCAQRLRVFRNAAVSMFRRVWPLHTFARGGCIHHEGTATDSRDKLRSMAHSASLLTWLSTAEPARDCGRVVFGMGPLGLALLAIGHTAPLLTCGQTMRPKRSACFHHLEAVLSSGSNPPSKYEVQHTAQHWTGPSFVAPEASLLCPECTPRADSVQRHGVRDELASPTAAYISRSRPLTTCCTME